MSDKVYIVEASNEVGTERSMVGVFSTAELAQANIPRGRWTIYEASVDGGVPRRHSLDPTWGD